jgi:serine phosphatase RsbU (regulator of sigma subunit)
LIGAIDHARFEVRTDKLEPGDAMLFFTDGLEALLLMGDPRGRRDHLSQTDWFAGLASGSIDEHIAEMDQYLDRATDHLWPRDDVTIVALSVEG